jgi:hypothetical protein
LLLLLLLMVLVTPLITVLTAATNATRYNTATTVHEESVPWTIQGSIEHQADYLY